MSRAEYQRNYKSKNRERINKSRSIWRSKRIDKEVEIARKSSLKTKYQITLEDYNQKLNYQGNVCAICSCEESCKDAKGKLRKLSVDHCHLTRKFRGLLCMKCNSGLGKFKDNIKILKNAINYLERNN